MNKNPAFDASIPVLTEVFQDQPVREDAPAVAELAVEEAIAAVEEPAADNPREPDWADLERRLTARILADSELEQRVRASIERALQQLSASLADEIRNGLQQTIESVVARAVGEELAQLQALKK
jgi:hypothetical protein